MKRFYFFLLAIATVLSTQLLFAQTSPSTGDVQVNRLIASRTDFSSSAIDLKYRNEFITEIHSGKVSDRNEEPVENYAAAFRIISIDSANGFEANFNAPKSGKAELSIRTISGQVIYKENIGIIKGSNSKVIKTQQLNNGMYLVSIKNEQVNYNGKIQKM